MVFGTKNTTVQIGKIIFAHKKQSYDLFLENEISVMILNLFDDISFKFTNASFIGVMGPKKYIPARKTTKFCNGVCRKTVNRHYSICTSSHVLFSLLIPWYSDEKKYMSGN